MRGMRNPKKSERNPYSFTYPILKDFFSFILPILRILRILHRTPFLHFNSNKWKVGGYDYLRIRRLILLNNKVAE